MIAVRVNETDTFADEDGANDEYFDFEDISGGLPNFMCQPCQAVISGPLPKAGFLLKAVCFSEQRWQQRRWMTWHLYYAEI